MPLRTFVLAGLLALGLPGSAGADLRASYGGELSEVGHEVRARLVGRALRLTVRLRIENRGKRVDEASLGLDLPPWAVATGLRIRDRGRWRAGALMPAREARRRYRELTTHGPHSSRGPALLSWDGVGGAELTLFPIAPGSVRDVEITLLAAPCYADGLFAVSYPWRDGRPPQVSARGRGAQVVQPGNALPDRARDLAEQCSRLGYSSDPGSGWILFPARERAPAGGAYGRFSLAGGRRQLVRLEVDAAPEIEPAPRRARVLFVVDASYSQGPAGIKAQLELVRGYLAHVPDASFEIVLYRRNAQRLFGRFVPARSAGELLAALPPGALDPGNGSHLDRGLALAASLARGGHQPIRIVAFTDSLLRSALPPAQVVAALDGAPRRSVVHLVDTELGGAPYRYHREDDHVLASVPARFGGMMVQMSGAAGGLRAARAAMLGLVRPIQIDHFAVEAPGLGDAFAAPGEVLGEGEALRIWGIAGDAPREVVLRGKIWGRDFERRLSLDRALSAELPALVFGTEEYHELTDSEVGKAAEAGQVVSPATSYLADPGAPPSSYDYEEGGVIGYGSLSGSGVGFSTHCGGVGVLRGRHHALVKLERVLRDLLSPRVRACAAALGAAKAGARVALELTGEEIVDVSADSAEPRVAECVAEAAWELDLGESFRGGRRRFNLSFDAE